MLWEGKCGATLCSRSPSAAPDAPALTVSPPWPSACPFKARPVSSPPCRLRDGANKEILGIIVSYKVKVKLVVSRGG